VASENCAAIRRARSHAHASDARRVEEDFSLVGPEEAAYDVERRRFAGAIGMVVICVSLAADVYLQVALPSGQHKRRKELRRTNTRERGG
jgi:hypothetical protein